MGGVAFDSNTTLDGLILALKPSPWTCNVLWPFDSPYYVQIMTKTSSRKNREYESKYPRNLRYLRLLTLMGTQRRDGKPKQADSCGQLRTCLAYQKCKEECKLFPGMDHASSWRCSGHLSTEDSSVTFLLRGVGTVF